MLVLFAKILSIKLRQERPPKLHLKYSSISKPVRVINIAFKRTFFKEWLINFLMISRLIDFAFVVLYLRMFEVCVIIGISKIMFFNFCRTERVKQNKKEIKIIQNLPSFSDNHFSINSNKRQTFFCFFYWNCNIILFLLDIVIMTVFHFTY